jgi:hypothetical protein
MEATLSDPDSCSCSRLGFLLLVWIWEIPTSEQVISHGPVTHFMCTDSVEISTVGHRHGWQQEQASCLEERNLFLEPAAFVGSTDIYGTD